METSGFKRRAWEDHRMDDGSERPAETVAADDQLPSVSGRVVMAGSLWTGLAYLLPQLYTLAISVVAARFLGPEGMGLQSFIAWAQITVSQVFTGGLPISIIRYVSESLGRGRPDVVRGVLRWAWRLESGAAVIGASVLLIVSTTRVELRSAWVFAAIASSMAILHTVPNSVLLGLQRWREASIIGLTTGAVGTISTIIVLAAGGGITEMFMIEAVVSAVSMVWAGLVARQKLIGISRSPEPLGPLKGQILRYAGWNTLRVVLTMIVWRRSELFFLDRYSAAEQMAMYSIAFSITTALSRIPDAFVGTLLPAFANLFGAGSFDRIRSGFSRGLRLMIILSLPLATGAIAVGPELLRVVYGSDYRAAGPVLIIMMATFPFVVLWRLSGSLLQGMGSIRTILKLDGVTIPINIGLALALIPDHGALGAAVASVTAQVTGGIILTAISARKIGPIDWQLGVLIRAFVAAAAAGCAGWITLAFIGGLLGLVLAVINGMIAYALFGTLLRVLPKEDADWLEEIAGDHLGGMVTRAARAFARA